MILIKNLTIEDINSAILRIQRTMQDEKASLDSKVTNIISGSSKSNNNVYNDNALRTLIKALQDLTEEHTKSINSLLDKTKDKSDKIAQLSTKLSQINFVYDPETKTIIFTGADGKSRFYTLADTTYTFSFDEATQTLTIHNDLDVVPNPDYNPADPESPQNIPDDTNDFVQQIKGTTYTFTWSSGKLTIHNNLSTVEHPIENVVIDFDNRYYTETEIDALIISLDTRLDAIEKVIPAEATENNKLADKNWVATAISISAATFRGTFNSLSELQAYTGPRDQNDFAFIKTSTGYDQYTWVPSGSSGAWTYEFSLETLSSSIEIEVDNCNHSVYLVGSTTSSGCDTVTTLCGSSDIHFNPAKRQLFANNIILDSDETCSGSWSGGLRINRGLQAGTDFWNGLMLGGQRGTTCGCTETWWLGNDYSTNNTSGNNGKLFITYEGAASANQERGYFTKYGNETLWRGNVSGNIYKDAEHVNWKSIDLRSLDSNTIYPVAFPLISNSPIVHIKVHSGLTGASKPSWSTHISGFAAELDMYDQPFGWGTIQRRTYVKQADIRWVNESVSRIWGYSQLTNSSIGVLWLRGGAVWYAWNSVNTGFTVVTSSYTSAGQTVAPTTPGNQPTLYTSYGMSYDTVSNAVNATNANHATSADSAENATCATNATHAVNADCATNATNATCATNATNAVCAVNSTCATNATHAESADCATNATNATCAINASCAVNATHAVNADCATNATNAVNATCATNSTCAANATSANSVIDYNNSSHPICIGYCGNGLSTANHLAAYSADGNCIKDIKIETVKSLLTPNFLELAKPTTCIQTFGCCWHKELFENLISGGVGCKNHQGLISQLPSRNSWGCMGIYVGRDDNFTPGKKSGTCYWFSPYGEITGTNQSDSYAIELIGKSRFLSVFNDGLNAICGNLMLLAKNYGNCNNLLYLKGWCPECQSCVQTRVDQAYWSCCAENVYLCNQTDSNADYEIPTVVNATPNAWSLLGITCTSCGKPTWNPYQKTFRAPRIVAGEGSFGFSNDMIDNNYSSMVPYVCIASCVNNQPLYVRVQLEQNRCISGGHIHITHYKMDATINLDQAANGIAYYCGGTYGITCFSIPSYECGTQYLWLYFANSWWAPRISSDIPITVCSYRSLNADQLAEINLGDGWHSFTDIRSSAASADNSTCFNGYTWAQACAIFTSSVTPTVKCDNKFYLTLGVDSNGNIIRQGNSTMWFNPGTRMNAMCSIATDPVTGDYTEGIRLNRSNITGVDSYTTLLIGDCYGTYSGNCDGIWIGRHHSAADNQKLFFTWKGSNGVTTGYMYFPTANQGPVWCGNVCGQSKDNIKSILGSDTTASNIGDWHKMVTDSGISSCWTHILNLNWTEASDDTWPSRLYLPTGQYAEGERHMWFATNNGDCKYQVLDNGPGLQRKTGGLNASFFASSAVLPNRQTGTLSAGAYYYIHLFDMCWGCDAYRGTVDVDYSVFGSGVVDSLNFRASSNGYDNSLETMGVCLNRTSYGGQSSSTGTYGLIGVGFIHNTTYQGKLQVWGKFRAYANYNYVQYFGANFENTRNLYWCGNGITTTSPSFTCFVCVKPSGQKAFHWFNGETSASIEYATQANNLCHNITFTVKDNASACSCSTITNLAASSVDLTIPNSLLGMDRINVTCSLRIPRGHVSSSYEVGEIWLTAN